jgi:hypothetical protein
MGTLKGFIGLTGGTIANLDGKPYSSLTNNYLAYGLDGITFRSYQYSTTETGSENAPFIIVPDDNTTGTGAWVLRSERIFYPDASQADQGAAVGGLVTVKDIVDAVGTSSKATIVLERGASGNSTSYIFLTSETIPSNIDLQFENGAMFAPATSVTVTPYSPENIIAGDRQQIFTGSGKVKFTKGGTIHPGWFGVVADDDGAGAGTDNSSAIEAAFNSVCQATGGVRVKFQPGFYNSDDIPQISINSNTNGGYDSYFTGSVYIDLRGCQFYHSGTGPLWYLQGAPSVDRSITIDTGVLIGTADTEALIKGRDMARCGVRIEQLKGVATSAYLALFQNWYSWTENLSVTGSGGPAQLESGLIQIECQSADNAATYEGVAHGGGTASFARFRMFNAFSTGSQTSMLICDAGVYDSFIHDIGGNSDSSQAIIQMKGAHADTVIHNIGFEGGSASGNQYVVDCTSASAYPVVYNVDWGGSDGHVTGMSTSTRSFEIRGSNLLVDLDATISGDLKALTLSTYNNTLDDLNTSGSAGVVSVPTATPTKIISASYFSGNTTMLVCAKDSTNAVVGYAMVTRKQGTTPLDIQAIGTAVGGAAFTDDSGDLDFEQTSGGTLDIRVYCLSIN